jgi:hypothetical protein
MNKLTAVYFTDANDVLKLRLGTVVFIGGVTHGNQNFSSEQIGYWIEGLKVKHPTHPVIADLRKLKRFLKKEKIDLVL